MKHFLKLFLLISLFTVFYSCEKDDKPIEHEHGEIIPSPKSDISFSSFLNKVGLDYYKSGNKLLGRYHFGYKAKTNFKSTEGSVIQYIDTTNIVAFEFDNIHSYTFNAVPVSDTLNNVYNVIFYQDNDGLQSKLLKYVPDFDFINSSLPFSGVIHEIDNFNNIINIYTNIGDNLNKNIVPCTFSVSVVSVNCTGANHEPGQSCECGTPDAPNCTPAYTYNVLDIDCNNASAGGGNSDPDNYPNENPDNPPSGGGGNSTSNPDQNNDGTFNLPTDPVKPSKGNQESTPEQKLKAITDILDIKSKLHTMKNNADFVEYGMRINRNPENDALVASPIVTSNKPNYVRLSVVHLTEVFVHTHPTGKPYPMYSGPDIIKMGEMIYKISNGPESVVNKLDVTHILIADGRTFALRFDDLESTLKLRDIYLDEKKKDKFIKTLHSNYKSDVSDIPPHLPDTDIFKQQEHMFNLFKAYSLNMSLYEANYDSNGRITTWEKVENED